MPASHPQPMTEVPKPVMVTAAWRAQRALSAVITTAVARMVKASAKVSSIRTPLTISSRMAPTRTVPAARWRLRALAMTSAGNP